MNSVQYRPYHAHPWPGGFLHLSAPAIKASVRLLAGKFSVMPSHKRLAAASSPSTSGQELNAGQAASVLLGLQVPASKRQRKSETRRTKHGRNALDPMRRDDLGVTTRGSQLLAQQELDALTSLTEQLPRHPAKRARSAKARRPRQFPPAATQPAEPSSQNAAARQVYELQPILELGSHSNRQTQESRQREQRVAGRGGRHEVGQPLTHKIDRQLPALNRLAASDSTGEPQGGKEASAESQEKMSGAQQTRTADHVVADQPLAEPGKENTAPAQITQPAWKGTVDRKKFGWGAQVYVKPWTVWSHLWESSCLRLSSCLSTSVLPCHAVKTDTYSFWPCSQLLWVLHATVVN